MKTFLKIIGIILFLIGMIFFSAYLRSQRPSPGERGTEAARRLAPTILNHDEK